MILDLCGGTGAWSQPYADAGYTVKVVDIQDGGDVRLLEREQDVDGVLAAPPCTHLSSSGARYWASKGPEKLLESLAIVDACIRIVYATSPTWWCLENPVGRLKHYLGPPVMIFQPYEYGDPWQKRTCLWGDFIRPLKSPVEPTEKNKLSNLPPSKHRARDRSITPPGFARAFFLSNP